MATQMAGCWRSGAVSLGLRAPRVSRMPGTTSSSLVLGAPFLLRRAVSAARGILEAVVHMREEEAQNGKLQCTSALEDR